MTSPATDLEQFWQRIAEETLPYHRCDTCDRVDFPPLSNCRFCGATIDAWRASAGRGTIRTWTLIERSGDPVFKTLLPFAVAIVEMDEGFMIVAGICPPHLVDIGRRCRTTFRRSPAAGRTVPHFLVEV